MKFGTDGMRGIYGSELTDRHAQALGFALAKLAKKMGNKNPKILVGRDTRGSGNSLLQALACGAKLGNANVESLGIVPTPAVQFGLKKGDYAFGVAITASHNAAEYNGLKVFLGSGAKLSEQQEKEIEALIQRLQKGAPKAKISVNKDIRKNYIDFLKSNLCCSSKKIAIDCANGSAYKIAKQVFCDCNVVWLSANPNGKNINKNCGSTHIKNLQDAVTKNKCDIGFAFDGDADRCLAVNQNGNVLSGDHILFILAKAMKDEKRLLGGVVATEMSSLSLGASLNKIGISLQTTKTGDKFVKERMVEQNYNLGGEQSGHIIIGDKAESGDGILTAIELLCCLQKSGKKASELANGFQPLARVEINVSCTCGSVDNIQKVANELNCSLTNERVVVRKSGTENVVRIMCESGSLRRAKMFATYFQALLEYY